MLLETPCTSRSAAMRGRKRITPHPITQLRMEICTGIAVAAQPYFMADGYMDMQNNNNDVNNDQLTYGYLQNFPQPYEVELHMEDDFLDDQEQHNSNHNNDSGFIDEDQQEAVPNTQDDYLGAQDNNGNDNDHGSIVEDQMVGILARR